MISYVLGIQAKQSGLLLIKKLTTQEISRVTSNGDVKGSILRNSWRTKQLSRVKMNTIMIIR